MPDAELTNAVESALGNLGLNAEARLLADQDMWTLPALPEIGLGSLVMSDGPIGVRGVRWTAAEPSIALPSPTALAATWDPELALRTARRRPHRQGGAGGPGTRRRIRAGTPGKRRPTPRRSAGRRARRRG
ncbi:hypothetical protein SAMN04487983_1002355 [Streptomyces sp. yr375]|uniref:hypothetical protein n=1 Tax=Streptomyces sp. yr375 TaxID=1761906 RepID=UPI0008BEE213|nr:hypothetical protein [Streptomyces sp. yr375]SEP99388.1 hypothetical protein SAMN04487983_1002355 [Streptomyces sp. yr375]